MRHEFRWRFALVFFLAAGLAGLAAMPAVDPAEQGPKGGQTALLIVDIQNFYYPGGLLPLVNPEAAGRQAKVLLDSFRTRHWPVFHIRHLPANGPEDNRQYAIHPDVAPVPGETVIGKRHANAFRETGLLEQLKTAGITRLVICGMQTHMCVEAAARAGADLGFEVTVAGDACATRDLSFGGVTVPAAQVHAATLAALAGSYGQVRTVAEWLEANPVR